MEQEYSLENAKKYIKQRFMEQGDFLIRPLIRKVEELRYTKHSKKQTTICAATLGNDAGIIGAALLSDVK